MFDLEFVLTFGQIACAIFCFIGTVIIVMDTFMSASTGRPGSRLGWDAMNLLIRPAAGYVFLTIIEIMAAEAGLI